MLGIEFKWSAWNRNHNRRERSDEHLGRQPKFDTEFVSTVVLILSLRNSYLPTSLPPRKSSRAMLCFVERMMQSLDIRQFVVILKYDCSFNDI